MSGFGNMPVLHYEFVVSGDSLSYLLTRINEKAVELLGERDITITRLDVTDKSGTSGTWFGADVTITALIHPNDAEPS